MCLQAVGASCTSVCRDCVPFEELACEFALCGEVNPCGEAVAKASPKRANESHDQDPKRSDLSMGRLKRR